MIMSTKILHQFGFKTAGKAATMAHTLTIAPH